MSLLKTITESDLRVVPIFGIDFSLNNVNPLCRSGNMHSIDKRNEYIEIIKMIAQTYENITNLAMFGIGAKTSEL